MSMGPMVEMGKRMGFDEVAIEHDAGKAYYLKIANSKIDSILEKSEDHASIFVSKDRKVFQTYTDRTDRASFERAFGNAKANLPLIEPKKDYMGLAEGPFRYPRRPKRGGRPARIDIGALSRIAERAIGGALDAGAENVAGTVKMTASAGDLSASNGASCPDTEGSIRISIRAFVGDFSAQEVMAARGPAGVDPERFGKRVAELAGQTRRSGRIGNGRYDIVYLPSPGGSLLSMANEMACMGNVENGSFLTGKMGKEVASEDIDIFDDGREGEAIGSSYHDEEGTPTRLTRIIGRGRLESYLHNASTARKYKTSSTGNAGLVQPEPNIFRMRHRKTYRKAEDVIGQVDRGIIVTNTWYTRFSNYLTGDFSTVPRDIALYVEKGEVKFAIKQGDVRSMVGIRITDNMIRMLKGIECTTSDSVQTSSWDTEDSYYFAPTVLVRGAAVTTA